MVSRSIAVLCYHSWGGAEARMRYLIAVALMLVSAAVPAYARGARHGTITRHFSGSTIVPPLTGTIVPPFTGAIVPPMATTFSRRVGIPGSRITRSMSVRTVHPKIITVTSNGAVVEVRLATHGVFRFNGRETVVVEERSSGPKTIEIGDRSSRRRNFGSVGDFGAFGDFGSFGGFGGPAVISEAPPGVDFIEPQPAPLRTAAELPPCHETTSVGVIVERGTACSHVAH
jgi:hypothetical protein